MDCFSELTYAIYCDDELPVAEADQVKRHLEECLRCRARVESLREENCALQTALLQSEQSSAYALAVPARRSTLLWKILAFMLLAALPHWILVGLEQQLPSQIRWLDPLNLSGFFNLISSVAFYLAKNGAAMISLFDKFSNVPALTVLVVLAVLMFQRFRHKLIRPGLGLLMLFVLVIPGYSLETRSSKTILTVPASETINDTLIAGSDTIQVDGTINGDLIAFGRRVEVHGTIKGDLITFAQKVEIDGTVDGNIFSFAQSVFIPRNSQVGGNLIAGAGDLTLEGTVAHGVLAATGSTDLRGTVNGDFKYFGGQLTVTDPAHIGGNLSARMDNMKHLNIAPGVFIGGKKEVSVRHSHRNPYTQPKFYFWKAVGILGALLVGLILWLLVPTFFQSTTQALRSWLRSLGLGFAVLFGVPVAVVILSITLVGLPLGLIALVAYLVSLYVAELAAAFFLGRMLFRPSPGSGKFAAGVVGWTPPSNMAGFLLMLAVGWILLTIVFQIPYGIGAIVHFLVFCFGLGAVSWYLYRCARPQNNA